MKELFNEDYFEHGVTKRVSGYENYRWIPYRSISEAIDIIRLVSIKNEHTVLEFGCAKGFLTKALRLLGTRCYGYDISTYAIQHCEPSVKHFLFSDINNLSDTYFDVIIAKDVLEHIPETDLPTVLKDFYMRMPKGGLLFVVVPLGDNNLFRIREYEIDVTHVTKKDEEWWINMFNECGFVLTDFRYSFGHIKENWTKQYPFGNGMFILRKDTQ